MEKFFISRPIFAISLAIVIVLVGLISITQLPIEQYPDITPPVVEVSATYDGADAETVNNAVATPVAQAVMGVSDILKGATDAAMDAYCYLEAYVAAALVFWVLGFLIEKVGRGLEAHFGKSVKRAA